MITLRNRAAAVLLALAAFGGTAPRTHAQPEGDPAVAKTLYLEWRARNTSEPTRAAC